MGMQPEGQSTADNQRYDFAQIGKVELMSTGALKIPAVLGRVGVFSYNRGGKVVRELRPPDEVFRADSMKTFASAAATDLHPPRADAWVTPKNWKKHAVGYVPDGVRQDGDLLRGDIVVQDADMIDKILKGERKELSPGYMPLELDATPGRYDAATGEYGPHITTGVEYDAVQRDIVYNSVGIGPRGWGRQGSAVSLRLDSDHGASMHQREGTQLGDFLTSLMKQKNMSLAELAQETGILAPKEPEENPLLRTGPRPDRTHPLVSILDGWTNRPSETQLKALAKALDTPFDDLMKLIPDDLQRLDGGANPNPQQASETMELIDIRLDGLTASVPKAAADIINKVIGDRDSKIQVLTDAATVAASEGKGRLDGLNTELAAANKTITELPEKLRGEMAVRGKLEAGALTVLSADINLDGKTDREVQELVLQAMATAAGSDALKLDGEDENYIRARYDVAMQSFKAPDATAKAMGAIAGGTNPKVRQDSKDVASDPTAAWDAMVARNVAASKPATA